MVLASNNAGKLAELRELLAPLGLRLLPQAELGVTEAEEPHRTFVENALAKARHAAAATGLPALADDSGLACDGLDGAPGVLSARWAGRHGDDRANLELLLAQLADVPDEHRGAQFVCAAALAVPSGPDTAAHPVIATVLGPTTAGIEVIDR